MFAMVRSYEAKHGTPAAALAGDEAFRERRRSLAASAAYYTNDVLQLPSAAQVCVRCCVCVERGRGGGKPPRPPGLHTRAMLRCLVTWCWHATEISVCLKSGA